MTENERAAQAKKALALIDDALALLEEASYEDESESGDDLFWAVDRYIEAHHRACERPYWDEQNEVVPSPKQAIESATKALQ
jgi:hypothetical protein